MQRQTTMANESTIERKWYVIDAEGKNLGRLASEVSFILTGKNKPIYTPHVDCGDNVIIINAEKIAMTGNKLEGKKYYNHSGYPGGLRIRTAKEMVSKYPVELLERTIWGMLPKGRLGRDIYRKLYVYAGPTHKHEAQKPVALEIKGL